MCQQCFIQFPFILSNHFCFGHYFWPNAFLKGKKIYQCTIVSNTYSTSSFVTIPGAKGNCLKSWILIDIRLNCKKYELNLKFLSNLNPGNRCSSGAPTTPPTKELRDINSRNLCTNHFVLKFNLLKELNLISMISFKISFETDSQRNQRSNVKKITPLIWPNLDPMPSIHPL